MKRMQLFYLLTLLWTLANASAQAELIYALRVNALNAAGNYNYRENNNTYGNYYFSSGDNSAGTDGVHNP